jgi:hypothetical protein
MKERPPENFPGEKILPEDTLRLLAQVDPPVGLAERIEARLASTEVADTKHVKRNPWLFSFVVAHPRMIAASLTICSLVGGGAGFYHFHKSATLPPPVRMSPGSMGAAGAIRVAPAGVLPPADAPVRTVPKNFHGRAVVQAGAKPRPKGVGVPNTPPKAEKVDTPQQ